MEIKEILFWIVAVIFLAIYSRTYYRLMKGFFDRLFERNRDE